MTTKGELQDLISQQSAMIEAQTARIVELEAEITRLNAEGTALQVLKRVYSDPSAPLSAQLKAAGVAVAYETPRQPTLSINADVTGLADRLQAAREAYLSRCKVVDGRVIHPPDDALAID
jgi:hypothetical protein